jgi:uncharacterized protein YbjQ (UPF0145 family)
MDDFIQYFPAIKFVVLMALGYTAGTIAEKKHFEDIKKREKLLINLPVVTGKNLADQEREIETAVLVVGSAVISTDYFKRFAAALKNVFGGRLATYESIVDRGRREALLRMKEMAGNADIILNAKIDTTAMGRKRSRNAVQSVEVIAYGTAITYKK